MQLQYGCAHAASAPAGISRCRVRSAFGHTAAVEHKHLIHLLEARQSVRDQHGRAASCDRRAASEDRGRRSACRGARRAVRCDHHANTRTHWDDEQPDDGRGSRSCSKPFPLTNASETTSPPRPGPRDDQTSAPRPIETARNDDRVVRTYRRNLRSRALTAHARPIHPAGAGLVETQLSAEGVGRDLGAVFREPLPRAFTRLSVCDLVVRFAGSPAAVGGREWWLRRPRS